MKKNFGSIHTRLSSSNAIPSPQYNLDLYFPWCLFVCLPERRGGTYWILCVEESQCVVVVRLWGLRSPFSAMNSLGGWPWVCCSAYPTSQDCCEEKIRERENGVCYLEVLGEKRGYKCKDNKSRLDGEIKWDGIVMRLVCEMLHRLQRI